MARASTRRVLRAVAALALVASCSDEPGPGVDGDADGDADGDGSGDARDDRPIVEPNCLTASAVDLLWVIDNSNSMREEQNNLAANFTDLMDVLTHPVDIDGDGHDDFPPVEDLRVGVVTTDMGVGDNDVMGCTATGDDGVLVPESRSLDPACEGVVPGTPPWIEFHAEEGEAAAFSEQFACLARLGTDGCGFEQQLSAAVAGLVDRAGPGGPNEGFVRSDTVLAIVFVTDEDDCSAADDSIFTSSTAELGHMGTRCAFHPELLHPISHFVTALGPFTLDRPGGVVVAAIAGVPPDLVEDPDAIDYEALLADERMQFVVDPADERSLLPACSLRSVGDAAPARRMVEFIQAFSPGERGLVQSICSTDLRPAMQAIARLIARRLCDRPS